MLRLWIPILPEHVWSKVAGQARRQRLQSTSRRSSAPAPSRSSRSRRAATSSSSKQPGLLGRASRTSTSSSSPIYQNADTMTQDLKTGALDYAPGSRGAVQGAQPTEPSLTTNAADLRYLDELVHELLRRPGLARQPGAPRPQVPAGAQLGGRQARRSSPSPTAATPPADRASSPPTCPRTHWSPPPEATFGFDLEKAKQLLDAAGYTDTNGDGMREHKGKPIDLRLWARSDDVASQNTRQAGHRLVHRHRPQDRLSRPSTRRRSATLCTTTKGDTFAPDYDMYIWGWGEYVDPDYILNLFTTGQIEGWNDPIWSNAEYDKLYEQQAQDHRPGDSASRWSTACSRSSTPRPPYVVTNYEQQLEAYNTDKWEGWTRVPVGSGPVAFINDK